MKIATLFSGIGAPEQAGNSMTVAVVEMIFRQIDKALKKEHIGGLF